MRDGSCDCLSVAGPHQKRNINKNFILDFNFGHHYDDDDGDDDKDDESMMMKMKMIRRWKIGRRCMVIVINMAFSATIGK